MPGDVTQDHIRDYLRWLSEVGHQRPNGPAARARSVAAIRSFFKYAHRAGLLRDNPAADIALPRIRMGEIRVLSQDDCCPLLRVVGTNPSPFRRVRDRAMIFTFLLTGARLREIVQLDRADGQNNLVFPPDEYLSSRSKITLFFTSMRVVNNAHVRCRNDCARRENATDGE